MAAHAQRWQITKLLPLAKSWFAKKQNQMHRVSEKSMWWAFVWPFREKIKATVDNFIAGSHHFSPLKAYSFKDDSFMSWEYEDRLINHLIWEIIRPAALHIIPSRSYFFHGGNKRCLRDIEKTLKCKKFDFVMRLDMKSFVRHEVVLWTVFLGT